MSAHTHQLDPAALGLQGELFQPAPEPAPPAPQLTPTRQMHRPGSPLYKPPAVVLATVRCSLTEHGPWHDVQDLETALHFTHMQIINPCIPCATVLEPSWVRSWRTAPLASSSKETEQ